MSVPLTFIPTRTAALARLEEFLPAAGRYAAERNYVREGHDNVSRISPWVQKRLLLESEIVAAARDRWSFPAVEKFVQEVYWRTYWKGWLEQRPAAWTRWSEAVPRLRASLTAEQRSTLAAALAGRTGIAGFDAWAKELVATGYLHNHARMWFASIWIFTLKLPWELGAAFFYEHLLDGDVASNTLSWRWVAGLQTRGRPMSLGQTTSPSTPTDCMRRRPVNSLRLLLRSRRSLCPRLRCGPRTTRSSRP